MVCLIKKFTKYVIKSVFHYLANYNGIQKMLLPTTVY